MKIKIAFSLMGFRQERIWRSEDYCDFCKDAEIKMDPTKQQKISICIWTKVLKKIEILYCEPEQGTILGEESEGEDDGEDEEEKRPFESLMV